MRAIAPGILALWTVSCAPAGIFNLVPRETSAVSRVGARWVGTESTQSTVSASYEATWLDHLLFEVEVVNRSDSLLILDPAQFSLTLQHPADEAFRKPPRPTAPTSPARVRARLHREASVAPGLSDALLAVTGIVLTTVVVAAVVAGDAALDGEFSPAPESSTSAGIEPTENPWAIRRADAGRALERLPKTLLQRTALAPGQSVRGELWFSARELRRALGPRPTDGPENTWSITTAPPRLAEDRVLTLRAPAALGGQEIDHFAWLE